MNGKIRKHTNATSNGVQIATPFLMNNMESLLNNAQQQTTLDSLKNNLNPIISRFEKNKKSIGLTKCLNNNKQMSLRVDDPYVTSRSL